MRKLIELSQENLIECDNPICDYVIKNNSGDPNEDTRIYINMPCPKCGDNLLTEKDYLEYQKLLRTVNSINKWFSWITIFIPKKKNETKSTAKIHNGIKIENKE